LDLEKLKGHIPTTVTDQILLIKELNSNLRLCHFISQTSHESGHFAAIQENLYYSAEGLLKVFPKYFTSETASLYAKQPERIANKIYANRLGNKDEASGDGWRYHGRGYIQITGKNNYIQFSNYVREDCVINPDLIANKYSLISAAWFFTTNNIWSICDEGESDETITKVTKKINGGINNLIDRINQFKVFAQLLEI
jgi:putative chitinase